MKNLHFSNLNPRYDNAVIDQNRTKSMILDISGSPYPLSGFALSGINAAAVAIVDGSGNQITSFGGGTQYTDGGTPPTQPVGPTLLWNNGGTWEVVSAAQPLPVTASLSLSNYALETGGNLASIKADTDKIPSLGQALAAGSVPVVLTAAQLSTLTPPSNAGYALDASLTTIDTDLKSNITLHAGSNLIGQVEIYDGSNIIGTSSHPVRIDPTGTTTQPITKLPNGATAISGIATATGTSDTAVIAAQGTGKTIYITSISIANSGSTTSLLTVETDTASAKTAMWYLINPAGGGDNITFDPPLAATASNKNVGFVAGSSSTTQYVSYNGYYL